MGYADEGTPKYKKMTLEKHYSAPHQIVLLDYATIKLAKLKIINDIVTSITRR